MIKLWVDDERPAPSGWYIARNYTEAIDCLNKYKIDVLSLDHDIASFDEDGNETTGYDIAVWCERRHYFGGRIPEKIYCHSANPVGYERITSVIKSISDRELKRAKEKMKN